MPKIAPNSLDLNKNQKIKYIISVKQNPVNSTILGILNGKLYTLICSSFSSVLCGNSKFYQLNFSKF